MARVVLVQGFLRMFIPLVVGTIAAVAASPMIQPFMAKGRTGIQGKRTGKTTVPRRIEARNAGPSIGINFKPRIWSAHSPKTPRKSG